MATSFLSGKALIRIHQLEHATSHPRPALVVLHGAGGNTGFWLDRVAPMLEGLGIALYAPQYFDRTGTQHADPATILDGVHVPLWLEAISDSLAYIRSRPGVDAKRIGLLGISLGAFLSLSLGAGQPEGLRAIVEISGGLVEPYASLATSAFPPTLILHGQDDQVVPPAYAHGLDTILTGLNVPHELHMLSGEGHWFSPAAHLQILRTVSRFLSLYL